MEKIKGFAVILTLAIFTFSFTACSDEDKYIKSATPLSPSSQSSDIDGDNETSEESDTDYSDPYNEDNHENDPAAIDLRGAENL